MEYKTLNIDDNLQEHILYNSCSIPLIVCIDKFDDYFQREWNCHWHNEFEFAVVLSGKIEYTIYDENKSPSINQLSVDEGIFLSSGCLHSVRAFEQGSVLACFSFPLTFFDINPFKNIYQKSVKPVTQSNITYLKLTAQNDCSLQIINAIKELCSIKDTELGYELHYIELACKVWRLLVALIESSQSVSGEKTQNQKKEQEQRLRKIISYIHTSYSDKISVEDMARAASISRTECFRCFNNVMKKTPNEYLTEYRLSMAAMLLTNTNRTLMDIALSCGFASASYFGKIFFEHCGITPKTYRETTR